MNYILQFTANIRHVRGEDNSVADALSRIFALLGDGSTISELDFTLLADAQLRDRQLQQLRSAETGLQLCDVDLPDGKPLLCGVSTDCPRQLVPQDLRRQVFQSLWYSC